MEEKVNKERNGGRRGKKREEEGGLCLEAAGVVAAPIDLQVKAARGPAQLLSIPS